MPPVRYIACTKATAPRTDPTVPALARVLLGKGVAAEEGVVVA